MLAGVHHLPGEYSIPLVFGHVDPKDENDALRGARAFKEIIEKRDAKLLQPFVQYVSEEFDRMLPTE